jgi:hypothetical protein
MSDMTRREFIALIGAAGLLLAVKVRRARAQQSAKIPRIGILDDTPMWQAFRQALRDLGYVEGQNIAYEYRYGEGAPDRLATVAAELVRRPVDLIATYGTQATHAAKEATATIPIVMIGVGDPVRAGLVESLARPGGNILGAGEARADTFVTLLCHGELSGRELEGLADHLQNLDDYRDSALQTSKLANRRLADIKFSMSAAGCLASYCW